MEDDYAELRAQVNEACRRTRRAPLSDEDWAFFVWAGKAEHLLNDAHATAFEDALADIDDMPTRAAEPPRRRKPSKLTIDGAASPGVGLREQAVSKVIAAETSGDMVVAAYREQFLPDGLLPFTDEAVSGWIVQQLTPAERRGQWRPQLYVRPQRQPVVGHGRGR